MNSEAHFSVALISAPAVGHVLPLFHLAQVLSSKGVSAALLVSDVALGKSSLLSSDPYLIYR